MKDNVNHPDHYTNGSVECIDAMKAMMTGSTASPILCAWWGLAFKYIWRWDKKDVPVEDLKKIIFYLNKMISELEK
tara:strand:- start:732 stop:959 length:228 start_codon:yes stop_codon:yes gene_type:complete